MIKEAEASLQVMLLQFESKSCFFCFFIMPHKSLLRLVTPVHLQTVVLILAFFVLCLVCSSDRLILFVCLNWA